MTGHVPSRPRAADGLAAPAAETSRPERAANRAERAEPLGAAASARVPSHAYAPIADYGIIGDLHTAALVGRSGSVDWFCPRAFDAPSVFASILDAAHGGYCRIAPVSPFTSEQRYCRTTAVLITTFQTATGAVELTDFMPVSEGGRRPFAEIHRRLVCIRGEVDVAVHFGPRFDYAAGRTTVQGRRHGVLATDADDEVLTLASPPEIWWSISEGVASATLKLKAAPGAQPRSPEDGVKAALSMRRRPSAAASGAGPSARHETGRGALSRVSGAVSLVSSAVARISGAVARVGAGSDRDEDLSAGGGNTVWFVVRYDDDEVRPLAAYESESKLVETLAYWDRWAKDIRYDGPYRAAVERSAITLKLLCYEPTGAIAAAPTTSLPEEIGGVRNWDYRFTWIRDSAFVLYTLSILGHSNEADRFMEFLKRIARRAAASHLQVMYGIDGRRDLTEQALEHLEGYQGSSPVRVGNAAYDQLQLDVYGELLETAYLWSRTRAVTEGTWATLASLVQWVADNWRRPDSGIWEVRAGLQHYVLSKVMCWVALDRGIRMAREFSLEAPLDSWEAERLAVHADVLAKGWSEQKRSFVQYYGTEALDASNLVIPMVGFLPHDDPRVIGTIEATLRELTTEDQEMVYRYRNADGIAGGEGVFSICTFWLAEALALAGRPAHAKHIFTRMLTRANHLGLYSEELDPSTGAFLGNFPQAFTHIALINCAHVMEVASRDGGRE